MTRLLKFLKLRHFDLIYCFIQNNMLIVSYCHVDCKLSPCLIVSHSRRLEGLRLREAIPFHMIIEVAIY